MNKTLGFWLIILSSLQVMLALPRQAYAQNGRPQAQQTSRDSTNLVIRRVNFDGNDHVGNSTLEALIRTHTNREFLSIPGFTPWYFIHKLTGSFGEDPALLNYETLTTDLERITRYYNSIGFLKASADTSINITGKRKVRVTFDIKEGERSFIKSIAYGGLPDSAFASHEEEVNFYRASDLTGDQVNDSTFKANLPYNENKFNTERTRIIDHLKNNGYAAAQRDSISALIKRHQDNPHKMDLLFYVRPGKRYAFGDLSIKLAGPGRDTLYTYQEKDTLSGKPYTLNGQKIYLAKEKSAQSRYSLLTNQIRFKPGDTFNYDRYIRTLNEFQNLGMLSIRQFGLSENNNSNNFTGEKIPVNFSLQTIPKHSINFNLFGLKRYGYGSGAGITYTNNNLFGKGENLQLNVNGSFEYVGKRKFDRLPDAFKDSKSIAAKSKFFRSFETRADYSLPRLTFPFTGLDEHLFFSNSRTRYSLSYNQSDQLLFDINADLTFTQRFEIKHNKRFTSYLDLLQLEILDANPSQPFKDAIDSTFKNNELARKQILDDFNPQFTSLFRYTFRSERTDLIKRNYGYYSEYSIGFGGSVPYLLDRFVVTPGTVEGSLPSPVKFSGNSLDYSRYVKLTADYRRYIPLAPNTVFANRGYAGYAKPYGQSKSIPLNQRFYAGGSNDIRGWGPFGLGPGASTNAPISGGEIKLLAQTELRQTILKNFFSSNWILGFFVDAGNVWYGPDIKLPSPGSSTTLSQFDETRANLERGKFKFNKFYKQLGVGSGAGIRLDFDYLVVRFDFAFRLHEPLDGWFQNKKLYFHFGIGQSF